MKEQEGYYAKWMDADPRVEATVEAIEDASTLDELAAALNAKAPEGARRYAMTTRNGDSTGIFPGVLYLGFSPSVQCDGWASRSPGAGWDEFGEYSCPAEKVSAGVGENGVEALYCRRWKQRGIVEYYRVVPYQLVDCADDDMSYDIRYLQPGDTSATIDGYEIHYVYHPSEIGWKEGDFEG